MVIMEARRPRIRATYKQLKLLVKFMGENLLLARGVDYRTAIGRYYHDSKWTELANLLNAQENGMNKSPRQWNRYWKDLKSGVKKKVHAMKTRPSCRHNSLTGIEQLIYRHICENKNKRAQDILEFTIPNLDKLEDIFVEKVDPLDREVTSKQIQLLTKFMNKNPSLIKSHKTDINRQYHDTKWTEIANALNEHKKSPVKTLKEWKSYWNDLLNDIRWKVLTGTDLSNDEQIVYKVMCENNNTEATESVLTDDRTNNYTPSHASDSEEDDYEVEYLEDMYCEEDQTTIPIMPKAEEALDCPEDEDFIDINQEFHTQDKPQEDCSTSIPLTEAREEPVLNNDINPNGVISDINFSTIDNCTTEVLLDIRNELKALVEVQKDRARSAQRLAAAQERKAILEEKKVRIEERRLKMEERRIALEEKKFEVAKKRLPFKR